jgi:hypothetical protein
MTCPSPHGISRAAEAVGWLRVGSLLLARTTTTSALCLRCPATGFYELSGGGTRGARCWRGLHLPQHSAGRHSATVSDQLSGNSLADYTCLCTECTLRAAARRLSLTRCRAAARWELAAGVDLPLPPTFHPHPPTNNYPSTPTLFHIIYL